MRPRRPAILLLAVVASFALAAPAGAECCGCTSPSRQATISLSHDWATAEQVSEQLFSFDAKDLPIQRLAELLSRPRAAPWSHGGGWAVTPVTAWRTW